MKACDCVSKEIALRIYRLNQDHKRKSGQIKSWQRTYLKISLGPKVLNQVGRNPPLMSVSLIMKIQHMRERLHAELAIEPTTQRVENLVLFLRAVPYCMPH
jgi:hypothetical protein